MKITISLICRISLTVAFLCVFCGCATVRKARSVQRAEQLPVGERTVTAAELGLNSNSVLKLDKAVSIALACNPAVSQAQFALAAATTQVAQAKAAYWPSVESSAGYSRSTANSSTSRGNTESSDSYSASLGLNLTLYDFGRTTAAVRQSVTRLAAAAENLLTTRGDVAFKVRTSFYDLCQAAELVVVAEESVWQFDRHLDQVRTLAEFGSRIRYEVMKAEVDLGNARLDLINARAAADNARDTLNRNLGLAENPGFRITPDNLPELDDNAAKLMAIIRRRHPGLLALRAQERLSSAAVDAAIADLYPSLKVSGSVSWSGDQLPLVWNWLSSVQSALELFSGGRKTARIEETVAELRAARARIAEREQQLYQEMALALRTREVARQQMALTELIRTAAAASLELINERYRQGKASALEVTDAQVALTRVQADQVKARFEYQKALAGLMHATGDERP